MFLGAFDLPVLIAKDFYSSVIGVMQSLIFLDLLVASSYTVSATSAEKGDLLEIKPIPITDVEYNGDGSTNKKGEKLCEGDMVCDKRRIEGGSDRDANNGEQYRWQKVDDLVIVPYVFESTLSDKAKSQVIAAAVDYAAWTCIKFVQRTKQHDYINFFNSTGCWSPLGRRGGKQDLSLGSGCDGSKGTPTHEMMHALGFHHEQTRNDRDNYVTVRMDQVKDGKEHNFDICTYCTDPEGMSYDYRSVMHYGVTAFSKTGEPTIIPKNGDISQIGQRGGLCNGDIKRLNQMYQCGGVTASTTKPNNGVVPCDEPTDRYSNCGDFLARCSDPDQDYRFLTMCPKTCLGKKKGGVYDRYSNCHDYANAGKDYCNNWSAIKEHCTLSCSEL